MLPGWPGVATSLCCGHRGVWDFAACTNAKTPARITRGRSDHAATTVSNSGSERLLVVELGGAMGGRFADESESPSIPVAFALCPVLCKLGVGSSSLLRSTFAPRCATSLCAANQAVSEAPVVFTPPSSKSRDVARLRAISRLDRGTKQRGTKQSPRGSRRRAGLQRRTIESEQSPRRCLLHQPATDRRAWHRPPRTQSSEPPAPTALHSPRVWTMRRTSLQTVPLAHRRVRRRTAPMLPFRLRLASTRWGVRFRQFRLPASGRTAARRSPRPHPRSNRHGVPITDPIGPALGLWLRLRRASFVDRIRIRTGSGGTHQ